MIASCFNGKTFPFPVSTHLISSHHSLISNSKRNFTLSFCLTLFPSRYCIFYRFPIGENFSFLISIDKKIYFLHLEIYSVVADLKISLVMMAFKLVFYTVSMKLLH